MKLSERLGKLIGHEVIVVTNMEEDGTDVPPGKIEEVGDDYVLVLTESADKGGFAEEGAEWFISLARVINVIHQADCKLCAVEDIGKLRTGKPRS